MYQPGGYDDVISSANKPEVPVAVHHASVSSDIKIPPYRGGGFPWIVLGIEDDPGVNLVRAEKGAWRP